MPIAFRCLIWLTIVAATVQCIVAAEPGDRDGGALAAAAEHIDQLINQSLAKKGLEPLPVVNDYQFARRFYLDAIGRIPSRSELQQFVASSESSKRQKLVAALLSSRGYVSHSYNFWADILRIKDEDAAISRAFYINWVKRSLADNKPYDEFVRELVTASGSGWKRGNGAVGYYLRDRGMPLDNIANTLRIFTGTRVACAQCHDHPHDRWTRRQFFEMAAFTHNVQTEVRNKLFGQIYERETQTQDENLRAFSQYIRNTFHADKVLGSSDGHIELPADYQYDDAEPNDVVRAHALFGPDDPVSDGTATDYRRRFGNWLTSPENPRFTQVVVNRLWKRAMGRGLIEPVDDIRDDTEATHPELLRYLIRLMKDLNYDMRSFLEVLYNTHTYQRAVNPVEIPLEDAPTFRGRQLARMTAEQAWDSLMALIVADVDSRETGFHDASIHYCNRVVLAGEEDMYSRYEEVKDHDLDEHWRFLERELLRMKAELEARNESPDGLDEDAGRGFYPRFRSKNVLARASELRSPAEPSHFLRTFGQSNRELIEGGNTASTVPQFLSMFNGLVEKHLLENNEALLIQQLAKAESVDAKIDTAFLTILSRMPTAEERNMILAMQPSDDAGIDNLVWALVNSQEFIFVQ